MDLKSNYVYDITPSLKKVILKHGFTEKEIYPKSSDDELRQHRSTTTIESPSTSAQDENDDEKLKEMTVILNKPVTPALINYVIRRNVTEVEEMSEKIKSFLDRVTTEFGCLNKVYLPKFLKNPDYQKDIYEIRDLLLSRLPRLKSFYRNYRNVNALYLLKHYGLSIFHLEFLKFEYEHPYEAVYFEKLQKQLTHLTEEQFEKLKPAVDVVYQNSHVGFLEEKPCLLPREKHTTQKNKLFIIRHIQPTVKEQLNDIDKEIVDNYEDLRPDISNVDEEVDLLKELISKCHHICVRYVIPNYIIKYVFGIQFLTF